MAAATASFNPSDGDVLAATRPLLDPKAATEGAASSSSSTSPSSSSKSPPPQPLGISTIRTYLLETHPNWTLSEKRLKAILAPLRQPQQLTQLQPSPGAQTSSEADGETNGNGVPSSSSAKKKKKKKSPGARTAASTSHDASPSSSVPSSHIDTSIALPARVEARYFDAVKGKGLVATRDIREGETIFTEDAFVAAPPSHAVPVVASGELCTQCFLPTAASSLSVPCGAKDCRARFCNRICMAKANATHHQLLCNGQNPSIKPFNSYIEQHRWLSLSSVSRALARVLLTHSSNPPPSVSCTLVNTPLAEPLPQGTSGQGATSQRTTASSSTSKPTAATLEETLHHLDAFATVSELERRARNPGWSVEAGAFLSAMRQALRLLDQGMNPHHQPPSEGDGAGAPAKPKRSPVKTTFPQGVAERLFSWANFLRFLGRANLNMEAQGGMYLVHSMLNHSCEPNTTVRHPPNRAGVRQATRVSLVASRAIRAGEELTITYQPLDLPLRRRRLLLWREYLFGPCRCARCERELRALPDDAARRREERAAMRVSVRGGDAGDDAIARGEMGGGRSEDEDDEDDEEAARAEAEEIQRRSRHAQMLLSEQTAAASLAPPGSGREKPDLGGLEEELREKLGF